MFKLLQGEHACVQAPLYSVPHLGVLLFTTTPIAACPPLTYHGTVCLCLLSALQSPYKEASQPCLVWGNVQKTFQEE